MFKKGNTRPRTEEQKPVKKSLTKALLAIVVAIVAWVGLTFVESYVLMDKNVSTVIVASVDIPEGTVLNSDNINEYVTKKEVNSNLVTSTTIVDTDQIKGKTLVNISAGEIMTSSRYEDLSYVEDDLKDPTEVSFSVSTANNANNGYIREGDLVDVYASVDNKDNKSEFQRIRENVYIDGAYDGSFAKINSADKSVAATNFVIKMEADDVASFKNYTENGTVILVKKDSKDAVTSVPAVTDQTESSESTESTETVDQTESTESTADDTVLNNQNVVQSIKDSEAAED